MGNNHSTSFKLKIHRRNKDKCDGFFIRYLQKNKHHESPMCNIESVDIRRVVFVSLLGLYQTWRNCPPFLLYTAIFILPLKRKWIYEPSKYVDEMKSCLMSRVNLFLANVCETKEFMELLRWKDGQGLVCWALDEYHSAKDDSLVRPFWCDLSSKLSNLYDHVTRETYNSLHLDTSWWKNDAKFISKFDTKSCNILSELYFCTMKFKTIQEIIFQSNPHSLHAVQYYKSPSHQSISATDSICESPSDADESQTNTNWVFCDGYYSDVDDISESEKPFG